MTLQYKDAAGVTWTKWTRAFETPYRCTYEEGHEDGHSFEPQAKRCKPNAYGSIVHEFDSTVDGARCECGEAEWKVLVDA